MSDRYSGLEDDTGEETATTDFESGSGGEELLAQTEMLLQDNGRHVQAAPLAATAPVVEPVAAAAVTEPAPVAEPQAEAEDYASDDFGGFEDEEEEEEEDEDEDDDDYEGGEAEREEQQQQQPQAVAPDEEGLSRAEILAAKKISSRGTTLSVAEQKLFGLSTSGRPLKSRFQVRSHRADNARTSTLAKPKASARTSDGASEEWVAANTVCSCRGAKKAKCSARRPQPGCARAQQVHALVEDAKNCTFMPSRSRKANAAMRDPKCGYDFLERDEDENFLNRMEARERSRQQKLSMRRGEAEYDARQDKKQCPQCGLVQSYDEVRTRKKRCPECHVEYKPKRAWGDIGNSFLQRCEEKEAVRVQKLAAVERKVTPAFSLSKAAFDSKAKRAVEAKLAGTSFLDRMEKDQGTRKQNAEVGVQRALQAQAAVSVAAAQRKTATSRTGRNLSSFNERMHQSVAERERKLKAFDAAASSSSSSSSRARPSSKSARKSSSSSSARRQYDTRVLC